MTPNGKVIIRKDSYYDSVLLMRISRELKALPGVDDAVVAMGTPQNKTLLCSSGYAAGDIDSAGPNDLLIAVKSATVSPIDIEAAVERLLKPAAEEEAGAQRPRSLAMALQATPEANFVLISVPGLYAAREARRALGHGLHVMLFSDNVSIEDEVTLKNQALRSGLLMMGPDCGTAIINGKPLGFANVVHRGSIGIVGASGTGIQEVSCCIHRLGGGISHAIGTGGRDLSDKVGGAMTMMGIEALAADPATAVLVVISKPPSPPVADRVIAALRHSGKPAVVHFVGSHDAAASFCPDDEDNLVFPESLADAAEAACSIAGVALARASGEFDKHTTAAELAARLQPSATLLGLFCGGTTAQEALSLLCHEGLEVYSNLHKSGPLQIDGTKVATGHTVLDLGADEFTVGRPHPMIEPVLRNEQLNARLRDSAAGLLLFDCVLGYGSHDDPAGVLAQGVCAASKERRGKLVAIASVTGTQLDPQGYMAQRARLEDAGVIVVDNNRDAVRLAAAVLGLLAKQEQE